MRIHRQVIVSCAALACWLPLSGLRVLAAQEQGRATTSEKFEILSLRVLSVDEDGRVTVDRGQRDGLRPGDPVVLAPKRGGVRRGVVVGVDGRTALVELNETLVGLAPGVRGEVRLPADRLPEDSQPASNSAADTRESETAGNSDELASRKAGDQEVENSDNLTERPPWENQDKAWRPGMSLLSRIRSVHPSDRARSISGRGYLIFDRTWTTEEDRDDSQVRVGSNLRVENPFGRGGQMLFDAEYDARTTNVPDNEDEDETFLRLERLSYAWGGNRYAPNRFEVGRFLQRTLPEFGVVDGFQWERRIASGNRYGASVGYLPELNADFETGNDFAVAAWYQWSVDTEERFTVTGGAQKTWHNGNPDRDLLVTRVRYLPETGWDFHGTTWIDFYGSEDDAKGSGPEVTQAIYRLANTFDGKRAMDVTFRRLRFAQLQRTELLPVVDAQLAKDRYDRLSVGGWTEARGDRRLHGEAGLWDDEDEAGGDLELGVDVPNIFLKGSRTDVTLFASKGRFSTSGGGRINFGFGDDNGRWDLFYELSAHRQDGFTSAIDDFIQNLLRGSRSVYSVGGWTVFFDLEALAYDGESAFTIGLRLEESF